MSPQATMPSNCRSKNEESSTPSHFTGTGRETGSENAATIRGDASMAQHLAAGVDQRCSNRFADAARDIEHASARG